MAYTPQYTTGHVYSLTTEKHFPIHSNGIIISWLFASADADCQMADTDYRQTGR